ncbi:MAG: radical SAM protein [Candidatus Hodarchaeota archaeon]
MVEWKSESQNLFERIKGKVPEGFRGSVVPLIKEAAEKRCINRNGSYVNDTDIITGIFDIIPEAFKPMMIEDLNSLGIDAERYIEIKDLKDRILLTWDTMEEAFHPGNIHFAMYVTDKCNMKCLHCAADDMVPRPELSVEEWIKIIDNIENGLQNHGRHACFIWFGGEPTLREDIGKIMKHCGDNGYYHAIITNGVEFTDEFAKMCKKNKMSHVFVSFDSPDPKKNDELRGYENSLFYAERAIKNALNNGLFVCSSITVMKQNVNDLDALKKLSEKWGAQAFFRAVVKQNRAAQYWDEIGLSQEEYKKLYDFKYRHAIDTIRNGDPGTLPAYEIYEMTPFMECPSNDKEMTAIEWGVGCLACRTMMGVGVDGTLYPCGYPTKLTLGHGLKDDFNDVLDSQIYKDVRDRKKRTGKCGGCHHLEMCGGGCRVHAECETGDFLGSFSYCWHENDHSHEEQIVDRKEMEQLE